MQSPSGPTANEGNAAGEATSYRVGTFEFDVGSSSLLWSDAVYEIYGYAPDDCRPTTQLLIDACHPDDRAQAARVLESTLASGTGCVNAHRIVTPSGEVRHVVIVGEGRHNAAGDTVAFTGYAVDVTDATEGVLAGSVDVAVQSMMASRAIIEQAKGALMLAFGVDADTAFGVLSWQSQTHNVKLRSLAEQVVADLVGFAGPGRNLPAEISHLLLTAHERVRT